MYVYADKAQLPDGNPAEHYAVHNTPSHPVLDAADVHAITALPPGQIYYAMQHVGEAWAYWNGCANNLEGHDVQTVTVGLPPLQTPNTQLWRWTGCRDERGGTTGGVELYIMPGSHGIERQAQDDGKAYQFLVAHPG
jgi:hypothetical protein